MICPYCLSKKTTCIDSRQNGELRRRKYSCNQCSSRFATQEVITEYDYTKVKYEDRPRYIVAERKSIKERM